MKKANAKIGRSEIALIHVAKKQLNPAEEEYRAWFERYGKESSKDLTRGEFGSLLRHLEVCGFRYLPSVPGTPDLNRQPQEKQENLWKIWALLKAQKLPWKYADGVAWRMHQVTKAIWCTPEQLHKLVIALEYRAKKEGQPDAK